MLVSKDAHTPLSLLPKLEETDLAIKHVKKALLDDDYHVRARAEISNLKRNRPKHNDVCKFSALVLIWGFCCCSFVSFHRCFD